MFDTMQLMGDTVIYIRTLNHQLFFHQKVPIPTRATIF